MERTLRSQLVGILLLLPLVGMHAQREAFAQATSTSVNSDEIDSFTRPFLFRSASAKWPLVDAGQPCNLTVRLDGLSEHAGAELTCVFRLVRVEDGQVVAREQTSCQLDESGHTKDIALLDLAPPSSGIYEIRCRMIRPVDPLWSRFQRREEELASATMPLIVRTEDADPRNSATNHDWSEMQSIDELDLETWQALQWVPGNASRLVPNVKRVSETITTPPWKTSDKPNLLDVTLAPGNAFLGGLPKQEAHSFHELVIDWRQVTPRLDDIPLSIQFSRSPTFESIETELQTVATRQLDLSSGGLAPPAPIRSLYVPSSSQMYCRVVNRSDEDAIQIRSAQFRRLIATTRTVSQPDPDVHQRPDVTLDVHDDTWVNALTADLSQLAARGGFHPLSVALYRVNVASARIPSYAHWFGCDEVRVGFDPAVGDFGKHQRLAQSLVQQTCAAFASPKTLAANVPKAAVVPKAFKNLSENQVRLGPLQADPENQLARQLLRRAANQIGDQPFSRDDVESQKNQTIKLVSESLPLASTSHLSSELNQFRSSDRWTELPVSKTHTDPMLRCFWSSKSSEDSPTTGSILLVNASPWRQRVELQLQNAQYDCQSHPLQADPQELLLHRNGRTCLLQVPASSLVCLNVIQPAEVTPSSNGCPLESWRGTIANPQPTIALCKSLIGEIIRTTGSLELPKDSYTHLRNGGFESDGHVGIVGWMQTQFPADAVVIDPNEAIEGERSIRMTNNESTNGRTWLVSETIPIPKTSRLAISLSIRAAAVAANSTSATAAPARSAVDKIGSKNPNDKPPPHRVRIALEGDRDGQPFRVMAEINVPRNGLWQPRRIVLESDGFENRSPESVRLTIDSLSGGTIWVDDIHLHEHFATAEERGRLHGEAYMAIQGLRRGQLAAASRLLGNHWTRYLLEQSNWTLSPEGNGTNGNGTNGNNAVRPSSEARPAWDSATIARRGSVNENDNPDERSSAETAPVKNKDSSATRGVAERIRDWLPRPIRF
ncbi:MAG: hypothetical protein AAFV88_25445 [Planctomycetota bacterium]